MADFECRLLHLFAGSGQFPLPRQQEHSAPPSRLCEVVWLEPSLFSIPLPVLVTEEFHTLAAEYSGRSIKPGTLGENMVISMCSLVPGESLQVGDAHIEVLDIINPRKISQMLNGNASPLPFFPAWNFRIIDEGLVEPGAPVRRI